MSGSLQQDVLRYRADTYLTKLQMVKRPVLLVEGSADRRFFKRLIGILCGRELDVDTLVTIETVETVQSPPGQPIGSNREKVEAICRSVVGTGVESKLTGFVDREFRRFQGCDGLSEIEDELGGHYVDGRLVWSRGHSVENYWFDFETLRGPLCSASPTDFYDKALITFQKHFSSALRLAAAVSLLARETSRNDLLRASIQWKTLDLTPSGFSLNDEWAKRIRERCGADHQAAEDLIAGLSRWNGGIEQVNAEVLRWICHGHIGSVVLWSAYARCVFETSGQDASQTQRVLSSDESQRLNDCLEAWLARHRKDEWPVEVLRLLRLKVQMRRSRRAVPKGN